jgi:hypothetical protein
MAQPTYVTAAGVSAGFATTVAVQIDFGSASDRAVLVQAFNDAGSSLTNISSIIVGGTVSGGTTTGTLGVAGTKNVDGTISGGTALTLETQIVGASFLGSAGNARAGRLVGGAVPTGVQWVQNVGSDGNAKPGLLVYVASGVASAAAGSTYSVITGSPSISVTSTANDLPVALSFSNCADGATISVTGATVQRVRNLNAAAGPFNSFAWEEPGVAGTVALEGTISGTTPGVAGTSWNLVGAASAPILTAPTGAATGPTQAAIGVTSDTTGGISSLILPAATAAPADAATLIADGAAIVRTIATAGVAQTFPITGLTTNTAVKVHWAMAGSNVSSSASFTPSTLAISGAALSAQTGTAGAAFVWAGATPESLITNIGNGSGSWTATAGVGASGVTVNSATGILVAGSLGTAGSYTITLQRGDGSTVPGVQTVTKTVGLTIGASGDVTPPTLTSPAAVGGSLTCSGSASTNEANGTLYTVFCASATLPTDLQVEAGQDSSGAAALRAVSQAVSATGSQPVVSGAITAGTRYAFFMHKDAAGNRSAVAASASFVVTGAGTYGFSVGPFGLNTGSGPVLGVPVSYTLTPGEVGAASGASINGTGTFHAATGVLAISGLASPGLYSVQIKNADGSSRWHGTATAA